MGVAAVEGLIGGQTDVMIGICNDMETYTPLSEAIKEKFRLNKTELRISKILSI